MRLISIALAGAGLALSAGAAQATLYCDPERPDVCVEQPMPPAYPPSVTYTAPWGTYTRQLVPMPQRQAQAAPPVVVTVPRGAPVVITPNTPGDLVVRVN